MFTNWPAYNNYITIKAWINKKKGTLCNFSLWQVQMQELIRDVPVSVYSTGAVTGNCMKSKNGKFPLNMAIIKHPPFFHLYFVINKTSFSSDTALYHLRESRPTACKWTQSQMSHTAQALLRPESPTAKVAATASGELRSSWDLSPWQILTPQCLSVFTASAIWGRRKQTYLCASTHTENAFQPE